VQTSSVKSITSPILFDNMNMPASEGLYDPALGPVDEYGRWEIKSLLFLLVNVSCGSKQEF
jgi:hypothetical protein